MNVVRVVFQIAVVCLEGGHGQINLDAAVAKSLAETAGDEHKADLVKFLEALVLEVVHLIFTRLQIDTGRYLRLELSVRILALSGGLEEITSAIEVVFEAGRRRLHEAQNLLGNVDGLLAGTLALDVVDKFLLVTACLEGGDGILDASFRSSFHLGVFEFVAQKFKLRYVIN